MIQTTNHSITIKRLVESSGEKTYTKTIANGVKVYIEPVDDTIGIMEGGEGAFNVFRMFSDYPIIIGDKVTDEDSTSYKVKGVRKYDSIVGKHYESVINSTYD